MNDIFVQFLCDCGMWFQCYRKCCPSASRQFDTTQPSLAGRASETTAPVCHPSVADGSAFMSCNEQNHTYHQHISRLSSSRSTECPGSIFDYHSDHPSVDLDDLGCDLIDSDETISDRISAEVNTRLAGNVIHEETDGSLTNAVISSRSSEVTDNAAVHVNCQSVAPSCAAKSKLPQSSSAVPVYSSRLQSRLPAPHSRAATKATSGVHCASKSEQPVSALMLNNAPVSSAGFNAGSKVGPSRFH